MPPYHTNQPIIVKNNGTLPQWISAVCSVATLSIVGYTAATVLDKVNSVDEKIATTVDTVKNPVKSVRNRFGKKK